ncbi:unnamed protein product, partial [Prorocentrum cordatum]
MAAAARMLRHALLVSQGQALPAPGTQAPYAGSRRLAQRYEYKGTSFSGMVDIHPERLLTREEFKTNLLAAPGVLKVVDKNSKTSQGNRGDHVFEQNLEVHLHHEPHVALEFEITRNNHMKHMEGRPYTETAMFKDPPKRHHAAAWRVLLRAVKGRELLPQHARDYCKSCLTRHGTWEDDVLPKGLEGRARLCQSCGVFQLPDAGARPSNSARPCQLSDAGAESQANVPVSFPERSRDAQGPGDRLCGAGGTLPRRVGLNVSGGARQASCPEGINYCEAGVTELRAFERDGNVASLVKAQDLLLKGIERISDVLPEGRDLDGTEYEALGAEFNRFAEIAEDARVRMRAELEAATRPAGGGQAVAGQAQGSGPGFASPATQGQKSEGNAGAEKTPPGFDPEAGWTEDAADVRQFDITADLREELAERPDGGQAAARQSREVRAALGAEVLPIPDFLKLVQGQPMASNAALDDVRAMKSRGVEHVRHRVIDEPDDPEVQDNIDRMRREAWEKYEGRRRTCARGLDTRDMFLGRELVCVKLVSAGAVPMIPNEFLNAASK